MNGCLACDLAEGRLPLPGGRIAETESWLVEHTVGPLTLGTLIVKPKRHVVHVADLTDDEAAELGPLLRRSCEVVTTLTRPEQVYVTLWSHAGAVPGHIHFVVQPVTRETMDALEGYGPPLQVRMFEEDVALEPAAIDAFAEKARDLF
jgi:diadenosine tetraphosphate (Ap4A) HIT family hydrolase